MMGHNILFQGVIWKITGALVSAEIFCTNECTTFICIKMYVHRYSQSVRKMCLCEVTNNAVWHVQKDKKIKALHYFHYWH